MCIWEKHLFQNDISPILNSYYPMKGYMFVIKKKIKRIDIADSFSSLIIFTKGANNSYHVCIYSYIYVIYIHFY